MWSRLDAQASAQGGVFTRRQALAAGVAEDLVRRYTRPGGPWVVVRRGAYVDRERWDALDEYVGRPLLRDRAAQLRVSSEHLMSHDSAARALALPFLAGRGRLVHVTRPGVGGSRTDHGVRHHKSRPMPEPMAVDGLRVTGLARTAVDLGREHGQLTGLTACDAALRCGVTRRQLGDEVARQRYWPGVTAARAAVERADPGAESVAESLGRDLLEELGLGPVSTQFPVRLGNRVVWCDLRIGCHLFEVDGRVKYRREGDGGVADRPADRVAWDERRREVAVCAEGFGMSRIVWADFWGPARERARERLRAEYAVTRARFGDRLPEHLARTEWELRHRRVPAV